MNTIRRVIVATLLAVWCFPAVSMANPAPGKPVPAIAQATSTVATASGETGGAEAETLAAREQKARELQDFRGGGAYVYIGSGTVLVVLVVVLIVLLV
jgi:hypothetical protein